MKNHANRNLNSQIHKFFKENFLRKSQVLVLLFLIVLTSCQQQAFDTSKTINLPQNSVNLQPQVTSFASKLPQIKVVKGRMYFKTEEEARQAVSFLHTLNYENLAKWDNFDGFTSLRSVKHAEEKQPVYTIEIDDDFKFTAGLASLLNQDVEYQIADSIFFLYKGYKLGVDKNDEESINSIKSNLEEAIKAKKVGAEKLPKPQRFDMKKISNGRTEAVFYIQLGASYYYECFFYTGGLNYKFQKELWNTWEFGGSTIITKIKFEYYQNGRWRTAGEVSNKSITNFNILTTPLNQTSPTISYTNASYSQNNSGELVWYLGNGPGTTWKVDYAYGSYKTVVPSLWTGGYPCNYSPCLSCVIGYDDAYIVFP